MCCLTCFPPSPLFTVIKSCQKRIGCITYNFLCEVQYETMIPTFGVSVGKKHQRLCPEMRAFHAEVPSGSMWMPVPDLYTWSLVIPLVRKGSIYEDIYHESRKFDVLSRKRIEHWRANDMTTHLYGGRFASPQYLNRSSLQQHCQIFI